MGKMTAFHPATLCWGFGRCLLRADTKPFPAALVRTLSRPFPPFGQRSLSACAVKGGAFQWVQVPPGQTLQPEATGAGMEVTKCLKPLGSRYVGDGASVRAATQVNAEQSSKRPMCRPSR